MPDENLIALEPYALLYTRAGAGVCLRDPLTGKVGVIFMELTDGMALERCLNGERPVRPDTSSLLAHFLSAMECRVRLVLINGRKDEVFYARVTIEAANEVMDKLVELDARPSDALMMAVRGIRIQLFQLGQNVLHALPYGGNNLDCGSKPDCHHQGV